VGSGLPGYGIPYPRGTSVTFLSPNHRAKNHLCSGRQCGCTGPDCGGLVSMKCVQCGADGMWGELRVNDGVCRAAGRWGAFSKEKSFNDQQRIDHCVATLPDVQRVWTPRLAALGDHGAAGQTTLSDGSVHRVAASRLDISALSATVQKRHAGVVSRDDLAKLAAPISAVSGPLAAPPVMAPRAATAGSAVDRPGLIYTVGGAASGGAFFGLAAEQGVAAWFDARENLRGYTTFGFSQGAQLSVGGEGVFGIWVVNDLAALGGDSWGCSVGASTGTGVGGTLTASERRQLHASRLWPRREMPAVCSLNIWPR
jgi:hypothetical protein